MDYEGFALKKPCKNCPFRTDDNRIKFRGAERASEIAEGAYRNGFPCHRSAELREFGEDESGYVFGTETQHCAGALIMFINDCHDAWPGIDNDEDLVDYLRQHLDFTAPVFEMEQEFIEANSNDQ